MVSYLRDCALFIKFILNKGFIPFPVSLENQISNLLETSETFEQQKSHTFAVWHLRFCDNLLALVHKLSINL